MASKFNYDKHLKVIYVGRIYDCYNTRSPEILDIS